MMNIDLAKATPIETEIGRRGIKLIGRSERVGPCPVCGGRDRFSINLKKQVWNCRGCGKGGDVVDLVQHIDGVGFKDAVKTLAGNERKPIVPVKMPARSTHAAPASSKCDASVAFANPIRRCVVRRVDGDNTEFALRIWDEAGDPHVSRVQRYFERRRLDLSDDIAGRVVKFHASCPWRNPDGTSERRPCMITAFRSIADDSLRAIQRTALTDDGQKIGRLSLGLMGGAAIKIDADEDVEQGLTIGEGFETCLAGRQLGFRPVWALGSAGAIANFPVLSGIDALTIHAETDDSGANARAIRKCGNRWASADREVIVATPLIGGDMNEAVQT
jgi:CHC2 zinc finger/Toprim domain